MVFCTGCGNNCGAAKFCSKCGKATAAAASSSSSSSVGSAGAPGYQTGQNTLSGQQFTKAFGLAAPGTKEKHDLGVCYMTNAGPCSACGKDITSAYMTGPAGKLHKTCWKCSGCQQQLGTEYIEKDGLPYCQPCAVRGGGRQLQPGNGTNCHGCGKSVGNSEVITFNERPWHVECFRCVECNAPIQGTAYRVGGDMEYKVGQEAKIVGGKPKCDKCGHDWKWKK